MDDRLIEFYRGQGLDHRGRRFEDILAWDDAQWERVHDFVQWVFPLPEPSRFNQHAPLLVDVASFRVDPELRANVDRALARMEQFLGAYGTDRPRWFNEGNHNHLRITRVLRFLTLIGYNEEAQRLLDWLFDLTARFEGPSTETVKFWCKAVKP